ncbi:MAG: radical SAM protein [Firmicutes bacterium]|nr:radical SAM protein [Bacillota bacterium]
MTVRSILDKALSGRELTWDDARVLMDIELGSEDMYLLMSCANSLSRKEFRNRGLIFAQVGLDSNPCSKNCGFCSLGARHGLMGPGHELSEAEVMEKVEAFVSAGIHDLFLMTTADYDFDKFLRIGEKVRKMLPDGMRMVANTGDFGPGEARRLADVGFTGAYHIRRLREGVDTEIPPEDREATLAAINEANLELYYCVEPIGPEHTADELIAEMFRAKKYNVSVMAAMRRIPVPGTPLAENGQISEFELAKVTAVARLVVGKNMRAMGVHEPSLISLIAGANQIYAETGVNPRDTKEDTSLGRGFSVEDASTMLWEAGWEVVIE